MEGGLAEAVRFSRARRPPNVVVSSQTASTIDALGAMALAISASRSASPSAPLGPGSVQAFGPVGWLVVTVPVYLLRNSLRYVATSLLKESLSSTSVILCPSP